MVQGVADFYIKVQLLAYLTGKPVEINVTSSKITNSGGEDYMQITFAHVPIFNPLKESALLRGRLLPLKEYVILDGELPESVVERRANDIAKDMSTGGLEAVVTGSNSSTRIIVSKKLIKPAELVLAHE